MQSCKRAHDSVRALDGRSDPCRTLCGSDQGRRVKHVSTDIGTFRANLGETAMVNAKRRVVPIAGYPACRFTYR